MRHIVRAVPVPDHVQQYAIRVVMGTQPGSAYAPPQVNEYVSLGSSPRGAQSLLLSAKVRALTHGRYAVSVEDVRHLALPVLRHRLLINFHGQSDRVTDATIVAAVLDAVREPLEVAS
jgi:MoxR-like ATPase